jgi:hypothetical protein
MTERRILMTPRQFVKAAGAVAAFVAIVLAGMLGSSRRVQAVDDDEERNESKIRIGFEIAPVHLNLDDKDHDLVGLGSYIVNAVADCNGCHNAGPGNNQFLRDGNPFFGLPTKINQATYLGGGRDFGALDKLQLSAHIISRNLTPDKTGRPEGGRSFSDFLLIMRTGADLDHLHPNCPPGVLNTGCVPLPFRGDLLQVMPWPLDKNMTDHDLRAIYEYLSAIPCIAGPPAPSNLHNDCDE